MDVPEPGVILHCQQLMVSPCGLPGDMPEGELSLSHALASSLDRFGGAAVDLVPAVGVLSL